MSFGGFSWLLILLFVIAVLNGCGGGGGDKANETPPPSANLPEKIIFPPIDFAFGEQTGAASSLVSSIDGGSVTLNGARLDIGPDVLDIDAQIGLVELTSPRMQLPSTDGTTGGHASLSNSMYVITTDRVVDLFGPITRVHCV